MIKGGILGAIILYIWMMISWMVLPWHCSAMNKFTNEDAVSSAIMANADHDGVYTLPNFCHKEAQQEQQADKMKKGPVIFTTVKREGFNFTSPRPYIISFIIQLIGAFFVTYLLLQTRPSTYWNKVWFVTAFGIAGGILSAFPNWNWWGYSFQFVLIQFFDFVIGWFLAGLALAAVKKD